MNYRETDFSADCTVVAVGESISISNSSTFCGMDMAKNESVHSIRDGLESVMLQNYSKKNCYTHKSRIRRFPLLKEEKDA